MENKTALSVIERGWSDKLMFSTEMQGISGAWMNELQTHGLVVYKHVPTFENHAGPLTKGLSTDSFRKHVGAWGLTHANFGKVVIGGGLHVELTKQASTSEDEMKRLPRREARENA